MKALVLVTSNFTLMSCFKSLDPTLVSFSTGMLYLVIGLQNNRGIKHDFPFINIPKVPREVLKTGGEVQGFQLFPRDLTNVNE